MLLAKENAAPCPLVSKPLSQPRPPSVNEPARHVKFKREHLMVDYLNRGVSVA